MKLPDNPYGDDALVAIRGYRERLTPKTRFKVIEIDFTADPAKDNPAWLAEQYRTLGDSMVRREVLRDWTVAAGDAYYPEYSSFGGFPTYSFLTRGKLLPTFVFRGWDFGERKPAIVWGQISTRPPNRVYIQRELIPRAVGSTYTLLDLCLFLSGQMPYDDMTPAAKSYYDALIAERVILPGPWYPKGTRFIDYAGHEALRPSASVKEGDLRCDAEILASKGVLLEANWQEVTDRVKVLRRLLQPGRDGKPLILVEECCQMIHGMLAGGLGYQKATEINPMPLKPREDSKGFHDLNDALTYPLAQLVPLADKVKAEKVVRTPLDTLRPEVEEEEGSLWYGKTPE